MIELTVRIDPKELAQFGVLKGNIRVAAAIGLTKVAKDAQAALKTEAGEVFHLRRSWVPQGVRIVPANAATLAAKVGSVDKYMERHVTGATKEAGTPLSISSTRDSQGRYATGGLLIGMYSDIGDARTHSQERRFLNRVDTQKNKTFQIIGRGETILVVRRVGKARGVLEVLAAISPKAKEKAIWHIDSTVAGVASARFLRHFEAAVVAGKARAARG